MRINLGRHKNVILASMNYPLKPFRCNDSRKLNLIVDAFPLATVVSQTEEWPMLTHIPLIREDDCLVGHFDANNPHVSLLNESPSALCLFQGPNHYITPSIYPDEQYPGWNYISVRVKTQARQMDKLEDAQNSLFKLAELHEPQDSGYRLMSEQKNFHLYSQHIRAFRFQILEMEGILKLSQDKGPAHSKIAREHLASLIRPAVGELLSSLLEGAE